MLFNELPTQEYLRSILDYNAEHGIFIWKSRQSGFKNWNTRFAGTIAGAISSNGYLTISINHKRYRAHRLAWVYVHGSIPTNMEIDHKDRDRKNNRIDNLRLATKSKNMANAIGKSRSGLPKGVERNKKRFTARIMVDGKRECLGTYDTPQEAQKAYILALNMSHGEFARAS